MRETILAGAAALLGTLALAMTGAQAADEMPNRKAGLWEVTMRLAGGNTPAQQMKLCTDAATDAALFKFGMNAAQGACSRNDFRRNGNVVTLDTECKMGESKMSSHAVMTFTGDSAYKTETKSHFDPPMMGRSDSTMTQDAKWVSTCPADMQPGDMIAPNGQKMNLKQLGQQ